MNLKLKLYFGFSLFSIYLFWSLFIKQYLFFSLLLVSYLLITYFIFSKKSNFENNKEEISILSYGTLVLTLIQVLLVVWGMFFAGFNFAPVFLLGFSFFLGTIPLYFIFLFFSVKAYFNK